MIFFFFFDALSFKIPPNACNRDHCNRLCQRPALPWSAAAATDFTPSFRSWAASRAACAAVGEDGGGLFNADWKSKSCWQPGDCELCRGCCSGGMSSSPVATGCLREALGGGRHRQSCFFPVRLILWARRISDEPIMTCRIWRGDLSFRGARRRRRTTGDRMQLIQPLRRQKAHDQNRLPMRSVKMHLLSCARAAIVMFQTVQSWIGPSYVSCRRLENLSGGLGSQN